jgi:hypothetical protein
MGDKRPKKLDKICSLSLILLIFSGMLFILYYLTFDFPFSLITTIWITIGLSIAVMFSYLFINKKEKKRKV